MTPSFLCQKKVITPSHFCPTRFSNKIWPVPKYVHIKHSWIISKTWLFPGYLFVPLSFNGNKGRIKIYQDTGPGFRRFLSRKKVFAPSFFLLKKLVAPLFFLEKKCLPPYEIDPQKMQNPHFPLKKSTCPIKFSWKKVRAPSFSPSKKVLAPLSKNPARYLDKFSSFPNHTFCYIETLINSSYKGLYVKFIYYKKYLSQYPKIQPGILINLDPSLIIHFVT